MDLFLTWTSSYTPTENLHTPTSMSATIPLPQQSAPTHHSRTTGHKIAWDRTTILTTTRYKTQLDLTEHTAIKTSNPSLNRTGSAPTCSKLWDPIIPTIACTIKPRPAGISFPKKKWFYYFSIFYYFRLLLLTSVKNRQPHLNSLTPLPLIIFVTGTDTTHPFIYHHSHHIHPWLKKTGTCLLKAPKILSYYFVSIKSLLFTTLFFLRVSGLQIRNDQLGVFECIA